MALDTINKEVSLWEHLEFPEGHSWIHANKDAGLWLEEDSFWKHVVLQEKPNEDVSLETSLASEDKLSSEENSLADWLTDNVDVAEIDEMVNSPEFHAAILGTTDHPLSMLSDINIQPFQEHDPLRMVVEDEYINSCILLHEKPLNAKDVSFDTRSAFGEFNKMTPIVSPSSSNCFHNSSNDFDPTLLCSPCSSTESLTSFHLDENLVEMQDDQYPPSKPSSLQTCSNVSADHKSKKRGQNKTAASRYRNKKRSEFENLNEEENGLLEKNKKLSKEATKLEGEVSYLKTLMKEILVAKGLLKA